jgi:hypothetical protein
VSMRSDAVILVNGRECDGALEVGTTATGGLYHRIDAYYARHGLRFAWCQSKSVRLPWAGTLERTASSGTSRRPCSRCFPPLETL